MPDDYDGMIKSTRSGKNATPSRIDLRSSQDNSQVEMAGRFGASVLEAVEHDTGKNGKQPLPTGAFSFNKNNDQLLKAVNEQLRLYRGTPDHRTRMSRFGITHKEIDPTLVVEPFRTPGD